MRKIEQKTKIALGVLALISFMFLVLFGSNMNSHEMTNGHGVEVVAPCPYIIGGSSICTMNLFDHISTWLNSLKAIPVKNILSLILFSLAFISFSFFNTREIRQLCEKYSRTKIRLYGKLILNHPIPLFVSLFSKGILNTKSY